MPRHDLGRSGISAIMTMIEKQLQAVVALPGVRRYAVFIKIIAGTEKVWGLYRDGWALAAQADGSLVFPMWPASEYARICAAYEWEHYEPQAFTLDELLNDLLPRLEQDGVMPGIFYTPGNQGITPSIQVLRHDVELELTKYL